MKHITVSAPGKLVLLGEHAVVYGYPCIVTAVDQRLSVTIEKIAEPELQIDAPDVKIKNYKKSFKQLGEGNIPKEVQFIEIAIKLFFQCHPELVSGSHMSGLRISTKSEFSSQYGFGSSSAVVVATIKALSELFELHLSQKNIFDLSYKTVFAIQKKGSGVDVAAAVYGGILYFVKGGKVIESVPVKSFPLIIGYSGIKADTVSLLTLVQKKAKKYPDVVKNMYRNIAMLIPKAKKALEKKDWKTVGELMNFNQGYLEALGVSSQMLSTMIYAARDAGAYGAKLSGAGGGDCMIALSDKADEEKLKHAIEKMGGQILDVNGNAEGVRREL